MVTKRTKQPEGFLSVEEMMAFLGGVHRRTVERLIQKGLPSYKLGEGRKARRVFDPEEVKAWIKANYRQKSQPSLLKNS